MNRSRRRAGQGIFRGGLALFVSCVVLLTGGWVVFALASGLLLQSTSPKVLSADTEATPTPRPPATDAFGLLQVNRTATPSATITPTSVDSALTARLQQVATDHPDLQLAIVATNLTTGASVAIHADQTFDGASTTKLITAAAVLSHIDQGQATEATLVNGLTIKEQLRLMVNQSNNTAWDALSQYVGLSNLQSYAKQQGLAGFTVNGNLVTANDLATVLTSLYQGKLLSFDSTAYLLSLMQQTNEERLIPAAALAQGVTTLYHKYGYLDGSVHDAGILMIHNQPVVLVIMSTSDSPVQITARVPIFNTITDDVVASISQ